MDDGVVRALVHARQHRVGDLAACEDVLLDHLFPALGGDLALEEDEEGVVLCDLADGVVEGLAVGQLLEQRALNLRDRALDGDAVVVAVLEFLGVGTQREDREETVHDVVVARPVAEEHVVFLMVLLQEPVAFFEGLGGDVGAFEDAEVGGGETDG